MRMRHGGFTLLELMIVAILVGVLAAIALPAYRSQVMKGNRSAAQQFMADVAIREQQYLLDTRSYVSVSGNSGFSALNLTVPTKSGFQYDFVVDAADTATPCAGSFATNIPRYKITASPTTAGGQQNDGSLCLDSTGNKTPASKWSL